LLDRTESAAKAMCPRDDDTRIGPWQGRLLLAFGLVTSARPDPTQSARHHTVDSKGLLAMPATSVACVQRLWHARRSVRAEREVWASDEANRELANDRLISTGRFSAPAKKSLPSQ
jgi:hypothetical protein